MTSSWRAPRQAAYIAILGCRRSILRKADGFIHSRLAWLQQFDEMVPAAYRVARCRATMLDGRGLTRLRQAVIMSNNLIFRHSRVAPF